MQLDETDLRLFEIFAPGQVAARTSIQTDNVRFVYYTSADTAMKVLRNQELWFRNATVMNDFSEISYGLDLIRAVFSGPEGARFRDAVDNIFAGTIQQAEHFLSGWENDWRLETYIACLSVHDPKEDARGRLSMWRAYGDTALVVRNRPMTQITDRLGVYSLPVQYFSKEDFERYLSEITDAVSKNRTFLQGLGQSVLVSCIHQMLHQFAIATKHPGFKEEKEWRIFYRPTQKTSPAMMEEVVTIGGVPQKVHKLRLAHEPENGLFFADIPSLLDRVIIGPSEFPYVTYRAFLEVLEERRVEDAPRKVVVSDIPLRIR